jgi:hypothetical protein
MQVDDILHELKDLCVRNYPHHYQNYNVSVRLSSAFVELVLTRQGCIQSPCATCSLDETPGCGDATSDATSDGLCTCIISGISMDFCENEFVNILSDIFIVLPMSLDHEREVKTHIVALWNSLSRVPAGPPLVLIPITKIRFLANMIRSHFPKLQYTEESEYIDSRTRRLLKGIGSEMFLHFP